VVIVNITWYGTAALRIESAGASLLFDPYYGERPRPACFTSERNILITHGHLDHLADVPEILRHSDARVYCTKTPCAALIRCGASADRVTEIQPGGAFRVGALDVRVLKGRHVSFDAVTVASTTVRSLANYAKAKHIIDLNRKFQEAGETVIFDVRMEGRRVLVLGSLAIDPTENYGEAADVLVLPYQGRSDLTRVARGIVTALRPRVVYLDHFDDAFPPISSEIDPLPFVNAMAREFRQMRVIVPTPGDCVEI
jgi:L-ascorbate metabolism protein UlaG (beta-lactamase superfamily)